MEAGPLAGREVAASANVSCWDCKGSFDISLSWPPGERPDGGTVDGWLLAERFSCCCGTMREMRESWWNWREGEGVGLWLWLCWCLIFRPGRRTPGRTSGLEGESTLLDLLPLLPLLTCSPNQLAFDAQICGGRFQGNVGLDCGGRRNSDNAGTIGLAVARAARRTLTKELGCAVSHLCSQHYARRGR